MLKTTTQGHWIRGVTASKSFESQVSRNYLPNWTSYYTKMTISVDTNKSGLYELWQQQRQLKIMEIMRVHLIFIMPDIYVIPLLLHFSWTRLFTLLPVCLMVYFHFSGIELINYINWRQLLLSKCSCFSWCSF